MSTDRRLALISSLIAIIGVVCAPLPRPAHAQIQTQRSGTNLSLTGSITAEQVRTGRGTLTPAPVGTATATVPLPTATDSATPDSTTGTDSQTPTPTDLPFTPTPTGTLAASPLGTIGAPVAIDLPTATIVPTIDIADLPPPPAPPAAPPTSTPTPTPTATLSPPPAVIFIVVTSKRKGQRLQMAIGGKLRLSKVADLVVLVRESRHHRQVQGALVTFDARNVGLRKTLQGRTDRNGIARFSQIRPAHIGFVYLTAAKHHFGSAHRHWAITH